MTENRIGIIDIGSNSVRLVIYERTAGGAHRVIDGGKRPARLSERIDDNGALTREALVELFATLNHFRLICAHNQVGHVRAVATAAIRNATNQQEVLSAIRSECGFEVELLSGEDEASFGFLGMINAMDVHDGFLVDIGGGSTEVSLFRGRELVRSISFPFGCVSLHRRFAGKGELNAEGLQSLERMVAEVVKSAGWLTASPGLPLIGVGGTARALGKIHQAAVKYPFSQTHNYPLTGSAVDELFTELFNTPLDKRRKFPGLSKDRADVIVPGIAVLRVLFRSLKTTHYRICGSGLRDGLFHATRFPGRPRHQDPLSFSVQNISALHQAAPPQHTMQVNRLALQLYDELRPIHLFAGRERLLLDAASSLFRIGASIDYYDYAKHTFYLIVNSHLNGLSHREILMIAAIASYKSKSRVRQQLAEYKELLNDSDFEAIYKLGMLLQLSAALDRSETQAIGRLETECKSNQMLLHPVRFNGSLTLEKREVDGLAADFKKQWGVAPQLCVSDYM
ncbi:Ppx/GppA phosphatase family protein [Paenibacillus sp. NEAU-GSW1]|uniref:Ppx/GppA phosphatase family protein n=1 Tax=Paenibacillus sp. NEAU-GSW1 TaxID=2682486 RepID=UPI0012E1A97F|nr:Ppx/GppA phosphatase family protein [Paenibacillus sp. NEAU-GSW1]MUT64472.1 Ppx/GppA family phosphatase [Paenibacillus sp. NEAU-GSW1]